MRKHRGGKKKKWEGNNYTTMFVPKYTTRREVDKRALHILADMRKAKKKKSLSLSDVSPTNRFMTTDWDFYC